MISRGTIDQTLSPEMPDGGGFITANFTLKKTGATQLKRRQDFCINAGIGETVHPTCLG